MDTDPTQNALMSVVVFKINLKLTPEKLSETLQTFIKAESSSKPGFHMDNPVTSANGVHANWSYITTLNNGAKIQMGGYSFISQDGNKISILTNIIPRDQYDALVPPLDQMYESYVVTPSVNVP